MHKLLLAAALSMAGCAATAGDLPTMPKAPTVYPPGELGEMVKLGQDIIMHTDTHPMTKAMVGNKLTCNSCHIDGGTTNTVGSFIGTATAFPAFSKREGTVQTLQDRINNCFMRSMNGTRPVIDSQVSLAMAAYVSWLSQGLAIKMNPNEPVNPYFAAGWPDKKLVGLLKQATHVNYLSGQKLFADRCAACHGADGQGVGSFPPVWGGNSYNAGAGLSKPPQMASWMAQNMPLGNANLTPQEVSDLTIYIDAQPHPAFDLKKHMLPADKMGVYNSKILDEHSTVRSNFKEVGLDVDAIRGDHSAE